MKCAVIVHIFYYDIADELEKRSKIYAMWRKIYF